MNQRDRESGTVKRQKTFSDIYDLRYSIYDLRLFNVEQPAGCGDTLVELLSFV